MTSSGPKLPAGVEAKQVKKLTLKEALRIGIQLHRQGRLQDAREMYRLTLKSVPDNPDALHFMGVVSHQLGDREEGLQLVRRAVALAPAYADAQNNLGNLLKEGGEPAQAEAAYRAVIAVQPLHTQAHNNLGVVLKSQGRLKEAEAAYRKALEIAPRHPEALVNLSKVLQRLGRPKESLEYAREAVKVAGKNPDAHSNLARALVRGGQLAEARDVVARWLTLMPDDPVALHMQAAYAGAAAPERASDGYVTSTFDDFADTFDVVLGNLDYQGPALMKEAMTRQYPEPDASLKILDAGCGTGLCAPDLARYASRLVGVDLSSRMLVAAKKLRLYDELVVAELVGYLTSTQERFDLLVCSDTLVYFGNIAPFAVAALASLDANGRLIFTVESGSEVSPDPGYQLTTSGRYCHAPDYIEKVLHDAGYAHVALESRMLRKEYGKPVNGLLVTAERNSFDFQ